MSRMEGTTRREIDSHLVAAAKNGCHEAWADLFEKYNERLVARLRSLGASEADAEDAVQTTWRKALEEILNYQEFQERDYPKRGSFFGWLCRIARNTYMDHCRSQARHRAKLQGDASGMEVTEQEAALDAVIRAESRVRVRDAIRQLEEARDRDVLYLYYFEDFTWERVSEYLGVTIDAVRYSRLRGMKDLAARLTPASPSAPCE